jgi:hypothetical protein
MEAPQGVFLAARIPYDKPATSIEQQIALARSPGLTIDDEARATHYLS